MSKRDVEEWFWQLGELQALSEEMLRTRPKLAVGGAWEPRIDVFEEEHRILVAVEIAGVRGDEIQLTYEPDRHALILRGNRSEEACPGCSPTGIHQLEILYGPFHREIELPSTPIDASHIRAQYRNGMLIIQVPKMERVVIARTITIREF